LNEISKKVKKSARRRRDLWPGTHFLYSKRKKFLLHPVARRTEVPRFIRLPKKGSLRVSEKKGNISNRGSKFCFQREKRTFRREKTKRLC